MISSVASAYPSPIKLLLVEDDQIDRLAFTRCVKQAGLPYDYTLASSLTEALSILHTQMFEIAILDYNLGDGNATDLFPILKAQNCPFVISTGSGDEETAARLMSEGAVDYLIKDPERNYLQVLPATVTKALARYQAEDQLRLLSHAIQSIKDGIYIVDTNGQLLFTNDALKATCDRRQTNVVGQHIQILGQPALTERVAMTDPCMGSSCTLDMEIPLHQADGSDIPMLLSECWIQDESDRIRVGVMRDITSLKQVELSLRDAQENLEQMVEERTAQLQAAIAQLQQENQERLKVEAALRQSEARWQFALEGAGDGLWDWNIQTNIVFFSLQWKTMLGYTTDEVGDRLEDWDSRVHPDDKALCYAELDKHFRGEIPIYQVEHRVRCKDGSYKWILARGKIIERTPEGQPLRIIGTHTDISDRKQAEDALRTSEAYQRALVRSLPDLIVRMDQQGTYLEFIAPQTFRVLGGMRNLIGNTIYNTLPPHLAQQRMAAVHKAIQTGTIQFYEQDLSADGNLQVEEVRVVPYGEAEALLLIRDISDRKRAELTLQKLVTGTAAVTGEDFFPALVSHIAEALEVHYAFVTEWVGDKLYTLGFWAHGALQPTKAYLTTHTPCEYTLKDGEFYCESLVQALFPEDVDLVAMEADSYLGIALKDDRGQAIGNLCILDVKPLSPTKRDEVLPILQVFAARAAAELQRKHANDALHQLNQDLEARVAQRTAELQEREAQLRDFFDNASDLIQSIAPDGRVLFVNRAWKETLGYDDADLAQVSIFQIIHPDDLEHCQTAMQRLFMGESCLGIETRFLTKDAREIIVEGNVNCQTLNGVPIATRGIFRDITDRKQAENALRESQQFLQTVLDTFPLSVFWKDRNSIYLGCNHNFLQDAGLTSVTELIGKTDDEMPWNIIEATAYQSDDQQVIDSGTAKLGIIESLHTAEGEMIWLETNKLPLRNLKGEVIGVLGTYQNITDRKVAEAALAASESFNRQLVEEFPVGLVNCRLDGQLVYVNSAFAKILGRTIEDTLKLTYWDITPIQYAEQEAEQLQSLQQHGRYGPYEKEYIHKDGYLVPVLLTGLIMRQNGEEFIWSSVQDISDRKKAEAQLQHTNEELARATRLKDEFLANMSHELRTPLNAILGMTEGLQDEIFGMINAQQMRALQTIESSATHLLSLINDILDVAKIESGQVELERTSISVTQLCSSSLVFIQQLALHKHIQLETNLTADLTHLVVDELRIRQVLINLLTNAVKFTPEGGRVTLTAARLTDVEGSPQQNYIRIAVMDTGIGIAPENISRLFQPFVQIDSALNRQHAGTGLGLALVKQIVELHGGRVGLRSELGVGSCFFIDLPCTPEVTLGGNQTMPVVMNQDDPAATDAHATARSPLILLAEDNPANISTIVSYLEAKGYHVLLARNGQEAVELTQAESPDLILMDIQMPGMDGIEAMQQIRRDSRLVHIPIIALTALVMKGDRERCLEAGANDYLSKPVKLKQLAAMIHQFLTLGEEGI